jgi:hypothetical protein
LRDDPRFTEFENRVLRRIFVLKRDEVTGEWRKLHIEELNNLFPSFNIFRVIKSRRVGIPEHAAFSMGWWLVRYNVVSSSLYV